MKLTIVHSYGIKPEIRLQPSSYAPDRYAYLIPDKQNFVEIVKSNYEFEKEMNEWIRKYDNLLNGLNYWKNRCLESP